MPQHALQVQPQGVQIVLWQCTAQEVAEADIERFFPERSLERMTLRRQREHMAVVLAVEALLGHCDWHLTHDENGKPWLHQKNDTQALALSLSHCEMGEDVWAAAAIWDDPKAKGGIDLALNQDNRIRRVVPRVMSPQERSVWAGREAWVWAAKESMFKGHGPALDFRLDAILDKLDDDGDGRTGTLTGRVRQAPWKGRWCLVSEALLVVWSE